MVVAYLAGAASLMAFAVWAARKRDERIRKVVESTERYPGNGRGGGG